MFHVLLLMLLVPDSEVLMRDCTVRTAGGWTMECTEEEVVRTRAAADTYSDRRYLWHSGTGSFEVLEAWTRTPSGKVVRTPSRAINVVSPYHLDSEPGGTRWRVTVVSHVGVVPVRKGSVLHTRWRRRFGAVPPGGGIMVPVVDPRPVRSFRLRVEGAEVRTVGLPRGCVTRTGGRTTTIECTAIAPHGTDGMASRRFGLRYGMDFLGPRIYVYDPNSFPRERILLKTLPDVSVPKGPSRGLTESRTVASVLKWTYSHLRILPGPFVPVRKVEMRYRAVDVLGQALVASALLRKYGISSRVVLYSEDPTVSIPALVAYPRVALVVDLPSGRVVHDFHTRTTAPWPGVLASRTYVDAGGLHQAPKGRPYGRHVEISYTLKEDGTYSARAGWAYTGVSIDAGAPVKGSCTVSTTLTESEGSCTWDGTWTGVLEVPVVVGRDLPSPATSHLIDGVVGLPLAFLPMALSVRISVKAPAGTIQAISWAGRSMSRDARRGSSWSFKTRCYDARATIARDGSSVEISLGCRPPTFLVPRHVSHYLDGRRWLSSPALLVTGK